MDKDKSHKLALAFKSYIDRASTDGMKDIQILAGHNLTHYTLDNFKVLLRSVITAPKNEEGKQLLGALMSAVGSPQLNQFDAFRIARSLAPDLVLVTCAERFGESMQGSDQISDDDRKLVESEYLQEQKRLQDAMNMFTSWKAAADTAMVLVFGAYAYLIAQNLWSRTPNGSLADYLSNDLAERGRKSMLELVSLVRRHIVANYDSTQILDLAEDLGKNPFDPSLKPRLLQLRQDVGDPWQAENDTVLAASKFTEGGILLWGVDLIARNPNGLLTEQEQQSVRAKLDQIQSELSTELNKDQGQNSFIAGAALMSCGPFALPAIGELMRLEDEMQKP